MNHYIIRPQAEDDLDEYAENIAKDNIGAALKIYDAAEKTYQQLAELQTMGEEYISVNPLLKNVRFFPIKGYKKYLVFYIPYDKHIEIVRVLNTSRNIKKILGTYETPLPQN